MNISTRCPDSKQYWGQLRSDRKLAEARNCQHEVGFQILWPELPRSHFAKGKITAKSSYGAAIFHASPDAIWSDVTTVHLHSVSVSSPPKHRVPGVKAVAEVVLHHEVLNSMLPIAEKESKKDRKKERIDLVLLLNRTRGAEPSNLMSWLAAGDEDKPECSWMHWFLSWFTCPTSTQKPLLADDVFSNGRVPLYHYKTAGCADTFVASKAIAVDSEQLKHFLKISRVTHPDRPHKWLRPQAVAVASGLSPEKTFTVFNARELLERKIHFGLIFVSGILFVVCSFLVVRWQAEYQEYICSMGDFSKGILVRSVMVADHWLAYLVAIGLPWYAYAHGYINRRTGAPWEFHEIFAAWLLGHCLHELYWFSRIGRCARLVPCSKVAMNSIIGPLSHLDFYLDIQFICVARAFGSRLAYWSLGVFILSNLFLQLGFFTLLQFGGGFDMALFKSRGFEVLHAVLVADQLENPQGTKIDYCFPHLFSIMKFVFEDIAQAIIQCLFVYFNGGSPLVYASVAVSLTLSILGARTALKEQVKLQQSLK